MILNRYPVNKTYPLGMFVVIWLAWLWLFWPLHAYMSDIFTGEDFRTNQLLLVGIVVLIVLRLRQTAVSPTSIPLPQYRLLPLILTLGSAVSYLLIERFLDINTLSATCAGLCAYGLLGLWLSPSKWRQGFPAMLLLIGTLPFGTHMQTFIGYPMRIATARIVQEGLSFLGISSIGVDTILVFENGVSHIDLPCSGVQSLWTGMLFLIAATWVEQRPLTLRWLLIAFIFSVVLFGVNIARVGTLIVVGEVFTIPLLAEMLHVPLGVLGFIFACGVSVLLLRRQPPYALQPSNNLSTQQTTPRLAYVLIVSFCLMALLYTERPASGLTASAPAWQFPAQLNTEAKPLKPDEWDWLTRDGAETAVRYRFEWGETSGSMILITSRTWRAHHRPERCFEVYGLDLKESRTHLLDVQTPVRWVSLGNDETADQLSATYWFQSAEQITDDYATRIWADVAPQRQRWVLVSILFDEQIDPEHADVKELQIALQESVQTFLEDS